MTKRFVSIGECMVEMAATGDGTFRQGFAGDTFNTAYYARRVLAGDWTVSYFTAVGDDALSSRMLDFMQGHGVDTSQVVRIRGRSLSLVAAPSTNAWAMTTQRISSPTCLRALAI